MNQYDFKVYDNKKIRVLYSTDTKNEADDQYVIAHAIMTPKFIVEGFVAAHYEKKDPVDSMEKSYQEIDKVLTLMGQEKNFKYFRGAPHGLPDENTPVDSEGARFIIEEAMKESEYPLFVVGIGCATDIASALLLEPAIAERITVIWLGGRNYPAGGEEFNLMNDVAAGNVLFQSNVPLWLLTTDVTSVMKVSYAELEYKVRPCGAIGDYLCTQLYDVGKEDWTNGESWIIWDDATVGLLLDHHAYQYEELPAPYILPDMTYRLQPENKRLVRFYTAVEPRFIFEDFFCKLALNFPPKR